MVCYLPGSKQFTPASGCLRIVHHSREHYHIAAESKCLLQNSGSHLVLESLVSCKAKKEQCRITFVWPHSLSWSRLHRDIFQQYLPVYLAFFEPACDFRIGRSGRLLFWRFNALYRYSFSKGVLHVRTHCHSNTHR
jgi:hypothetical protein